MMPKLRAFIDHVKNRSDAADKSRSRSDEGQTRPRKRR
jgi:hypothetical protein